MDVYGVIGDPIHHSLSPRMHNEQFLKLGIDATYVPFQVHPQDLEKAMIGLRALHVKGFNVTIPHKEAILPYLDEVETCAQEIGAVNTVILSDGKLIGTNTDYLGFIQSLKDENVQIRESKVLILGAGGAARAILYGLCTEGANNICIANRNLTRATQLAQDFSKYTQVMGRAISELQNSSLDYDIIVNTTSVGLSPYIEESPIVNPVFKQDSTVVDIIYNPNMTQLLIDAKGQGCKTINGIGMFIHQGAVAFRKWTGQSPDLVGMEQTIKNSLEGKK